MDVTYEERDAGSEGEVIDHVVATLSEASGFCVVDTASDSWCCTRGVSPLWKSRPEAQSIN
jgi:hypothetical protein